MPITITLCVHQVPEFDKHLKKTGGHIGRKVVEMRIKMKTIVRKPLMIKIIKLRLRNLDNRIIFFKSFLKYRSTLHNSFRRIKTYLY